MRVSLSQEENQKSDKFGFAPLKKGIRFMNQGISCILAMAS